MLIIVDRKMPGKAYKALTEYGRVVGLATENIGYNAISGHPDIFFFQLPEELVVAPNLPECYKTILKEKNIKYIEGKTPVGAKYPHTAHYNALYTEHGIIHNSRITDHVIKSFDKRIIHCNQAYVRCNTVEACKQIITSDKGIESVLIGMSINVKYINPQSIILPGYKHGFFGGCCGAWRNKFFVCGSLKYLKEGAHLSSLLIDEGYEIIELYDGELFDVGGIFFIEQSD